MLIVGLTIAAIPKAPNSKPKHALNQILRRVFFCDKRMMYSFSDMLLLRPARNMAVVANGTNILWTCHEDGIRGCC
jgi:hypothetical protein